MMMNIYVKSLLNGLMVYWDEEKDAARYFVHLLIGDEHITETVVNGRQTLLRGKLTYAEISVLETDRKTKYCSFINLAKIDQGEPCSTGPYRCSGKETGLNYYVYVEAEDREGKIISKSNKSIGKVYVMVNGYYTLKN